MDNLKFPTNVKQIGSIGNGLKIYLEDYAYSYLNQYSNSGEFEERIAMLIGRYITIDGQQVLFISGAIQGIHSKLNKGILNFTDKSWTYANEQIKKYFKGLDVVGWAVSQPGYGTSKNSTYIDYHMSIFKEDYNVMFVMDPVEKISSFYVYDSEIKNLNETRGYFVYFEKNNGMHEYMLNNKDLSLKPENKIENKFKILKIEKDEVEQPEEDLDEYLEKEDDVKLTKTSPYVDKNRYIELLKGEKTIKAPNRKKVRANQRRRINILATVSSVLFIVTFVMGAGLIQNETRISSLEDQLISLNQSYKNLLTRLSDNKVQDVFSNQEEENIDENLTAQLILENGNEILKNAQENLTIIKDTEEEVENTQTSETIEETKDELEPMDDGTIFVNSLENTEIEETPTGIPEYYVVQEGDSLGYISLKFYGTRGKMEEIMQLNNMDDPDKLFYGRRIKLPRN